MKREEIPGQIDLLTMTELRGQTTVFDIDTTSEPSKPLTKPTVTRYKAQRPGACDRCVERRMLDAGAPWPGRALWRRQAPGEPDQYLCVDHADQARAVDRGQRTPEDRGAA